MRKFLITQIIILTLMALGAGYDNVPKKTIPAQHSWFFSESELKSILKNHLESLGTNVPNGKIEIKGLEIHYSPENKGKLELYVREY